MKVPAPRKLKSGSWFIQLRLGGESIPITEATAKACTKKAQLVKAEYLAGRRLSSRATELTLKQLIEAYIKAHEVVRSPSTIRGYEAIKGTRFQAVMNRKINVIKDWQAVINAEAKLCSAKTLKNAWGLVGAAMRHAKLSPPTVTLPKVPPKERPWLDDEQIRVFIKAVRGEPCEIPALLALHSLRRSEIAALTWDHVDLKAGTIRVDGSLVQNRDNNFVFKETNKSKKSHRAVPIMIPALAEALEAVPKEERVGRVVTCHPNTIRVQINRVCETAGLPAVGVHGMRHSFASLALHVEMPEQETMALGGWEDAQTMHKIYEHISQNDRLKSQNKMAAFYGKPATDEATQKRSGR